MAKRTMRCRRGGAKNGKKIIRANRPDWRIVKGKWEEVKK